MVRSLKRHHEMLPELGKAAVESVSSISSTRRFFRRCCTRKVSHASSDSIVLVLHALHSDYF